MLWVDPGLGLVDLVRSTCLLDVRSLLLNKLVNLVNRFVIGDRTATRSQVRYILLLYVVEPEYFPILFPEAPVQGFITKGSPAINWFFFFEVHGLIPG